MQQGRAAPHAGRLGVIKGVIREGLEGDTLHLGKHLVAFVSERLAERIGLDVPLVCVSGAGFTTWVHCFRAMTFSFHFVTNMWAICRRITLSHNITRNKHI